MEELLKEIGARLKKYFDHRKLTVNQMGRMSDNEGTQIYNIVNGKNYGMDKFLRVARQSEDLNLYWLLWNEGGDQNMLRKDLPASGKKTTAEKADLQATKELMSKEIENLKSTITYQSMTIEVYKNALEISKASIEDLRKILDFYTKNDSSDKDDLLNSNVS